MTTAAPDDDLFHQVLAGDAMAFEVLARRHCPRLLRIAVSVLRDEGEAEDAVQQALLNAFLHRCQYAGKAPVAAWLSRITLHEALARRRRRLRYPVGDGQDVGVDCETLPTADPDPERRTLDRDARRVVEASIAALPEAYRRVVMLRAVEGLSTEAAAARLSVSIDVVKTRLSRARARLRQVLQENHGADRVTRRPRARATGAGI